MFHVCVCVVCVDKQVSQSAAALAPEMGQSVAFGLESKNDVWYFCYESYQSQSLSLSSRRFLCYVKLKFAPLFRLSSFCFSSCELFSTGFYSATVSAFLSF